MGISKYKNIRDEAEEYAKQVLLHTPANFTILHLECLKDLIPTEIDAALSDLKGKVILSQTCLLL